MASRHLAFCRCLCRARDAELRRIPLRGVGPGVLHSRRPAAPRSGALPARPALIDAQARLTVIDEIVAGSRAADGRLAPAPVPRALCRDAAAAPRRREPDRARLYRTRWAVVGARRRADAASRDRQDRREHARGLLPSATARVRAGRCRRSRRSSSAGTRSRSRCLLARPRSCTRRPRSGSWCGSAWRPGSAARNGAGAGWCARPCSRCRGRVSRSWRGPLAGRLDADGRGLARGHRRQGLPLSARLAGRRLGHQPDRRPGDCRLLARAGARAALTVAGETPIVVGALALVRDLLRLAALQRRPRRARRADAGHARVLDDRFPRRRSTSCGRSRKAPRPPPARRRPRSRRADSDASSTARGVYGCFIQFPDRRDLRVDIQHDDWRDAMAWARTTDPGSGWLADPHHAARYGSTVRAAGHRDVLIEVLKDPAIAMYDRPSRCGWRTACARWTRSPGTRPTARAPSRAATASTTS